MKKGREAYATRPFSILVAQAASAGGFLYLFAVAVGCGHILARTAITAVIYSTDITVVTATATIVTAVAATITATAVIFIICTSYHIHTNVAAVVIICTRASS